MKLLNNYCQSFYYLSNCSMTQSFSMYYVTIELTVELKNILSQLIQVELTNLFYISTFYRDKAQLRKCFGYLHKIFLCRLERLYLRSTSHAYTMCSSSYNMLRCNTFIIVRWHIRRWLNVKILLRKIDPFMR